MAAITTGNALELIRFTVSPEAAEQFQQKRRLVDDFLQTLDGFVGAELAQTGETDWVAIVHWSSEATARAAQQVTATSTLISDWVGRATELVSFDTIVVRYETTAPY